jgi:hypothetical protein
MRALGAVFAVVLFSATLIAQAPEQDINPKVHPYLYNAQRAIAEANMNLERAQKGNRYKLGGHAEKARQLLAQASAEIKAAANTANAESAATKKKKR